MIPHNGGVSVPSPAKGDFVHSSLLPTPRGSDLFSLPGVGPSTGGSWPTPHLARPGPGSRTHLTTTLAGAAQRGWEAGGRPRKPGQNRGPTTAILTTTHLPAESHTTDPDGPPRLPSLWGRGTRVPASTQSSGIGVAFTQGKLTGSRAQPTSGWLLGLVGCANLGDAQTWHFPENPETTASKATWEAYSVPSLSSSRREKQNGTREGQILSFLKFGEEKKKTF